MPRLDMPSDRPPAIGAWVFVALIGWFSLIFSLGLLGRLEDPPRPMIPLVLATLVTGLWLASRRIAALRQWLLALDIRALVGVHIVRLPIGIWFLLAYERGQLPGELALLAGWGDIATGVFAIAVLAFDEHTVLGRRVIAVFNAAGLLDILAVVGTAQKVLLLDADRSIAVGYPFVMLPLFVVPIVIVAHAWTFARLARAR